MTMTVKKLIVVAIWAAVDTVLRCLKKKSIGHRHEAATTYAATSEAVNIATRRATDDITFNAAYTTIYDVYTTRIIARDAVLVALFAATYTIEGNHDQNDR